MEEGLKKGIFITFEGPEGSGKSTQSSRLQQDLIADGHETVHTAEPGGTDLGKRIRSILLEKDDIRLNDTAELFLFEADRAQHVEEFILPAINDGKIVICDRFNTATFAYQGYGLGMDMGNIAAACALATLLGLAFGALASPWRNRLKAGMIPGHLLPDIISPSGCASPRRGP